MKSSLLNAGQLATLTGLQRVLLGLTFVLPLLSQILFRWVQSSCENSLVAKVISYADNILNIWMINNGVLVKDLLRTLINLSVSKMEV